MLPCCSTQVFEPDTLSIGSVDNPGTVHEEEEGPITDDLEQSDVTSLETDNEDIKNKKNISYEDTELTDTRTKEYMLTDDSDNQEIYAKEKLRQESKESDTAEVPSPVSIEYSFAVLN